MASICSFDIISWELLPVGIVYLSSNSFKTDKLISVLNVTPKLFAIFMRVLNEGVRLLVSKLPIYERSTPIASARSAWVYFILPFLGILLQIQIPCYQPLLLYNHIIS